MRPVDRPDPAPSKLSRKSALAVGAVTLLASGLFRQGLGIVTLAVTARLLSHEDFGIVAFFLIAQRLMELMQRQIGFVLIRLEEINKDHIDTVFTVQILFGLLAALLFWLSTPLVAMTSVERMAELMPAIAVFSIVLSLRSARFWLFERGLRFGYTAGEETIGRIAYSIAVVILAWLWRDFWSVVVASFIGGLLKGLWTFYVAPMRPRFTLSAWRESLEFSSWSMGAQLAQFLTNNAPQLLIGSTLGLAEAGIYRLGSRLVNLVTSQLITPVLRVVFPGLADLSRKSDRGREGFRQINAASLAMLLPTSVGLALVAESVIILGFGENWIAAAPVVWILAPLTALNALQANVRSAIYIEGSTRLLFFARWINVAIVVALIWIGVQFGFVGAVIGTAGAQLSSLVMTLILARRFGDGGLFEPLTVGWRSFLSCGAMAAAVLLIGFAMREAGYASASATVLLLQVLVGMIVYLVAHFGLWMAAGRPKGFEATLVSLFFGLRGHIARKRNPDGE